MWRLLYGPQSFADLSRFDGGTGPVWGQKLELKFASLRAKAGERTGIDLDGSMLTPLPTNSGLISKVIGAIAGKWEFAMPRGVCASRSRALVEAGGERFWLVPDHPRQGRGGEPGNLHG